MGKEGGEVRGKGAKEKVFGGSRVGKRGKKEEKGVRRSRREGKYWVFGGDGGEINTRIGELLQVVKGAKKRGRG